MGADPNSYSNAVVKMGEYRIDKLTLFQNILDVNGPKVNYGG